MKKSLRVKSKRLKSKGVIMASEVRHFLRLDDLNKQELLAVLKRGSQLREANHRGEELVNFPRKVMGMIFEKSSTRTRVSFEAAMTHIGGSAIFLSPRDTQLGRGEPIEDSSRILSSMLDIIMIRTFSHQGLEQFAKYSSVPVINALTDNYHPCQLLADMQTYYEYRGSIEGKTVTWVGDGNNMCSSYIVAAKLLGFTLKVASPKDYEPEVTAEFAEYVQLCDSPETAVQGSDLVVTDVWVSMGEEEDKGNVDNAFEGYTVSPALMDKANDDALFMHCLPAHRGEEVSYDMMDDRRSVVWHEAENRLHAQKALIEFLLTQ